MIISGGKQHQEGYYLAKVGDVVPGNPIQSENGTLKTCLVKYDLPHMSAELSKKSQQYLALKSNPLLRNLFKTVLGEEPEIFDTDQLIGKTCIIEIKREYSKKFGRSYLNVVRVHPEEAITSGKILNKQTDISTDNAFDTADSLEGIIDENR